VFIFIRQALAIIFTITVQVKLTPEQATVRDIITEVFPESFMLVAILAFFHPFQRKSISSSTESSFGSKDTRDSKDSKGRTKSLNDASTNNPTSTISVDSNPRQGTNSSISVDDEVV